MESTRSTRWTALAAFLLLPLAAACPAEQGGDAGMAEEEAAPAQEETGEQTQGMAAARTATLTATNESGVSGMIHVSTAADSVTVDVEATGMPGPGEYASHIHEGTCDSPGGVVVPLNSVMGQEGGSGTASTTVAGSQITGADSYLVMVHGSEGAPIACANLPALGGSAGM